MNANESNGLESLSTMVKALATAGVQRRAMLLRTEHLPPSLSRPEHLRRARTAIETLAGADRGHRFDLPGGRMLISWRGDASHRLDQALDGLSRLLQDDPVDAPSIHQLVQFYDLPIEGPALLEAAQAGIAAKQELVVPQAVPAEVPMQPLDATELDRLEKSLVGADLSRFARNRPISHVSSLGSRLAWDERSLSITELIAEVAPGRDARSDVWLFRRLTRLLDARMLSILSDQRELRGAGPFSITLNVASVFSPEFLRFDAALPPGLRNRVVICFLPADIASDAGAFAFARNFARERSYRVCVRAVSAGLLPALDLEALKVDFLQLIWSPELGQMKRLPPAGTARWIVGQPCTSDAVVWGIKQGITLFAVNPSL